DGDSITLTQTYMQSLSVGTTTLTFDFSAGANDTTEITVTDSTVNNSEVEATKSYDKNGGTTLDILTTFNGNTLTGINDGSRDLVLTTDYTVDGDSITLTQTYMQSLSVGTTTLTFDFSAGANDTTEITVTDSTPSSNATVTSTSYIVDSVANTITNVANATDVAVFKANLTAATGATFEVYESDGTTVRVGNINPGDKVIVTAEDTTKTYSVGVDSVFPIVAKLGDGSTDFTIAQGGSVNLAFNEPIRSASRTLVENALTNGADRVITFSWNAQGNTLTITGNATGITTFANDVIVASITDMAGNISSEVLLVDSVIETGQVAPVGGSVVINTTTPQAVISNPVEAVNVTITDGTNTTLDVNSLINDGTGVLPQITITANNAGNTVINIPANTTITSSSAVWNGLISTPQVTSASFPNEVVGLAIQVGSSGNTLTFDKGVRILLPGQAGKRIKFTTDGTTYNEVTNVCSADNQTTGDALAAGSDCKIDVGSDLVIWTKHFTTFITFTPTYSGGGGGGAPGAVISPQQVTNKPQTQKPSEFTKPTIPTQELTDAEIITLVENLSQGSAVKNKVLNSLAYNLKYGESGLAIKILQQMLIKYKFLSSEYVAQGYFDQNTATAVRQYKKAYVDSILSIEQVKLIAKKIAEIDIKNNAILRSLVDQTRYDERSVKVKIMQEVLKIYGLFPRNIESTGYYDGYTTLAVDAYNLTYSSSSATSDQISSLAKKIAEMRLRDNQILISFMDSTFYGEKSTRVKIMQEVLKIYGFFPKEIPSTGYYNGYTSSAIKKASEFMALNKKYLAMSFSGS
ncbi:hypothetical protein M0R01_01335, partial [bacterium]|nr:hypothetical protein [bacterium]